jgi:enamine deaminase RidA (YjgF/YER057c/UK114 family)
MTGSAADRRLRCVRGDIERLNPVGLHQPPGYHHVTVVSAGPTAYLAGQCPLDADGSLLGPGDIDAQVDAVVRNALTALAAVDATAERVVRSVIYVASNETGVLDRCGDDCRPLCWRQPSRPRPPSSASARSASPDNSWRLI